MIRRLALPLVAVALLAACGGDDAADSPVATTAAPVATTATGESSTGTPDGTGPAALQFSAPLVGGGQIDLAELGDQPVLLWFWAPW